jgi:ribosome-associated protein
VREVEITGNSIRLGQLLKLAGIIDSGAEAKSFLAEHEVKVNGEPDQRRGRQVWRGDVVATTGEEIQVV